jgi:prepilin-type processing-associated H-X9-DG protein
MELRQIVRLAVTGVLLAPYCLVFAQEVSIQGLLTGKVGTYATQLKLADLPAGYSAVKISGTANLSGNDSSILSLMTLAYRTNSSAFGKQYQLLDCLWTNGDTVKSMNKEFLVTYRLNKDLAGLQQESLSNSPTGFDIPSAQVGKEAASEPTLKICLVALESIQSVTPCPEITKETLISTFGKPKSATGADYDDALTSARQSVTLSNAKQVALGLMIYAQDYDDAFPYAQSTKAMQFATFPYVKNKSIFKSANPKGGMFLFNMAISGANGSSITEPASTILIFESEPWSDGRRAVAFCDGHAKFVNSKEWYSLMQKVKAKDIKHVGKPLPMKYGDSFDLDSQTPTPVLAPARSSG